VALFRVSNYNNTDEFTQRLNRPRRNKALNCVYIAKLLRQRSERNLSTELNLNYVREGVYFFEQIWPVNLLYQILVDELDTMVDS
jgi:hypothetical protein